MSLNENKLSNEKYVAENGEFAQNKIVKKDIN